MDLDSRSCLVVGGGNVALRKVKKLLICGANIKVISPEILPGLRELLPPEKIIETGYKKEYCQGQLLVFAATDSSELNERIYYEAENCGALVNVVDDPHLSDFTVPALVKKDNLQIAVSTGGKSPALAKKIRKELEGKYGDGYSDSLKILGEIRGLIKETVGEEEKRKDIFKKLAQLVQVTKSNEE